VHEYFGCVTARFDASVINALQNPENLGASVALQKSNTLPA
jgi:hypothetical protein